MKVIQVEIRNLHFEKQRKDASINKLKSYIKQLTDEMGVDDGDAEYRLKSVLGEGEVDR